MKQQLRKKFRALRSQINKEYREEASLKAASHLAPLALFSDSKHIACYLPFKDEFDSMPIIETIWHSAKTCYLPVLTDEKSLIFVKYAYGDALHHNRFGILEPKMVTAEIKPQALDLVITPLLAFDKLGTRLGAGGGYYDRTFAFLNDGLITKPHIVGLAYAVQESTDVLPHDPWDITLEAVITEDAVLLR